MAFMDSWPVSGHERGIFNVHDSIVIYEILNHLIELNGGNNFHHA